MASSKATVISAVLSAASTNSTLLNRLTATSEAPSALNNHVAHTSQLEDLLAEQEHLLDSLRSTVDSLAKSHRKLRDSRFRRLYHRATHMLDVFETRARDEESRYFAALSGQSRAEDRRRELRRELDAAGEAQAPLERAAQEHARAHEQIDALYEGLFAGPTPGFGQEDEKEGAFYAAREKNDAQKTKIVEARRGIKLVGNALEYVDRAIRYVRLAEQDAEDTLFFFGDALAIMQDAIRWFTAAVSAIGRLETVIGELTPGIRTVQAAVLRKLRDLLTQAERATSQESLLVAVSTFKPKVDEANKGLKDLRELLKQKEQAGLEEIRKTARQQEDWRQALYQVRMRIFEEVAGFGEAAPAYTECCDRAAGYCVIPDETHQDDLEMPEMGEGDGPVASCENTSQPPPSYQGPAYQGNPLPLITSRVELPAARRPRPPPTEKAPLTDVDDVGLGST